MTPEEIAALEHLRDNVLPDTLQELDNANATITELRADVHNLEAVVADERANSVRLVELRNEDRATIDRLTAEAAHLGERLAEADHMAKLMFLQSERWHEMAEDLHEELIEWHYDECPREGYDSAVAPGECDCHTIIEKLWTELVEGS